MDGWMDARTSCHSVFTYVCTITEWHAYVWRAGATFALARAVVIQNGNAAVHRLDAARDNSRLRQRQRRARQTAEQQQAARGASATRVPAARVAQPAELQQAAM